MTFTVILTLFYTALLAADICALLRGVRRRRWAAFVLLTAFMALSIAALGYLWIIWPM